VTSPLRIGVLGAARIAPMALLRPARRTGVATIVALGARDRTRAEAFARRHGIARAHGGYEAVLADPEVEAVYNPLPNSLHAVWTVRALAAGKHVLCEKPFASDAGEAETMAAAAAAAGRVLMEAFHYRYHALFARMRALATDGTIGDVRHLEASFCIPLLRPGDIRWRADLAGGALMDTGCYTVHLLRHLAGAEPTVDRAEARWLRGVDRWLRADLRFPGDRTARLTCGLLSATVLRIAARIEGTRGEIRALNPIVPQFFHRLRVRTDGGWRAERVAGEPTYDAQLRAFVHAVRDGAAYPTTPADAVANMRVIDAIYAAAGRVRPPAA
jgi:predicted dehydrogenase